MVDCPQHLTWMSMPTPLSGRQGSGFKSCWPSGVILAKAHTLSPQ